MQPTPFCSDTAKKLIHSAQEKLGMTGKLEEYENRKYVVRSKLIIDEQVEKVAVELCSNVYKLGSIAFVPVGVNVSDTVKKVFLSVNRDIFVANYTPISDIIISKKTTFLPIPYGDTERRLGYTHNGVDNFRLGIGVERLVTVIDETIGGISKNLEMPS